MTVDFTAQKFRWMLSHLHSIIPFKLFMPNRAPTISGMKKGNHRKDSDNEGQNEDMELPIFDLTAIANATDNFSSSNKLGEGGYGPVYKVNRNILTW
jgi:hypothetical protein